LKFIHENQEIKKTFEIAAADFFKHYEINFHLDCFENPLSDTLIPVRDENVLFPVILFDFDSNEIKSEYEKTLTDLAQNLSQQKSTISIIGHTDNIGSFDYNRRLALSRAEKVRNFLIKKGIPAERLRVESKSFSLPVETNEADYGRAKNRRVVFEVR
jgi:OOP family OmpA-OmpF porin